MFNVEPPRSRYDLNFRLFGVPVRVHPFFWLATVLLSYRLKEPKLVAISIAAVLLTILVHEFGHVLAFWRYGLRGRVVLHMFGGLAIPEQRRGGFDRHDWSPRRERLGTDGPDGWAQIVISLAGPFAGFILAGLIVAILYAVGVRSVFWGDWSIGRGDYIAADNLHLLVYFLLWDNILWGLVNLLPIFPLDGGHIARELFLMFDPRRGIVGSLKLSIVAAIGLGLAGVIWGDPENVWFTIMFAAMLAFTSYQILKAYEANTGYGSDRDW